ncbi:MAG: hypothetical protein AB8B50_03915 [Pirellulaceae bacterium]
MTEDERMKKRVAVDRFAAKKFWGLALRERKDGQSECSLFKEARDELESNKITWTSFKRVIYGAKDNPDCKVVLGTLDKAVTVVNHLLSEEDQLETETLLAEREAATNDEAPGLSTLNANDSNDDKQKSKPSGEGLGPIQQAFPQSSPASEDRKNTAEPAASRAVPISPSNPAWKRIVTKNWGILICLLAALIVGFAGYCSSHLFDSAASDVTENEQSEVPEKDVTLDSAESYIPKNEQSQVLKRNLTLELFNSAPPFLTSDSFQIGAELDGLRPARDILLRPTEFQPIWTNAIKERKSLRMGDVYYFPGRLMLGDYPSGVSCNFASGKIAAKIVVIVSLPFDSGGRDRPSGYKFAVFDSTQELPVELTPFTASSEQVSKHAEFQIAVIVYPFFPADSPTINSLDVRFFE